jgi:hypothetical protein
MTFPLTLLDLAGAAALLIWGVRMVQTAVRRAYGARLLDRANAGDVIQHDLLAHAAKRLKRAIPLPNRELDTGFARLASDLRAARILAAEKEAFRAMEAAATMSRGRGLHARPAAHKCPPMPNEKPASPKPPATDAAAPPPPAPREIGGPKGPEPTRYGDWEHQGRCIDF